MGRLRVRIKDKRICALVKAFLKAGVLTDLGDREETLTGTPQGGIATPPWGVPSSVRVNAPSSTTPAFSQPAIMSLAGNDPSAASSRG